jgi:para-nitrobenzyl esterase
MGLGRICLSASVSVVVLVASGVGTAAAAATPRSEGPVVVTADGAVSGRVVGGVDEFLGVPYAAPPVGPLRWRPPQPVARWNGVRDATRFAPHCAQPPSPLGGTTGSEDCLYLNVFAAGTAHRPRPVMLWIHGGALTTGESDDYDPTPLVRNGVVVVSINYRLGLFGFLAHPALASGPGGASGNYGLMDQQAALRWVRRNIGRFGGDPRDVTIFGESAGGLSVLSQMASPGARGLFTRAIVQSGAYSLTQASLAQAEAEGQAVAARAGCADQSAECLRGLPVPVILGLTNPVGYRPDVDGLVLTESIGTALATGRFNRVPMMNGTNHDEYRLFVAIDELRGTVVTPANYQSRIATLFGVPAEVAAAIVAEYPLSAYPSPAVALGAVGTDAVFACPALTVDQAASRYVPVYGYEFNDENAPQPLLPPVSFPYGAAHASELQYLFNFPTAPFPAALSPAQVRLSATMTAYWTNLAKRGFPSWLGAPLWPPFEPATHRMQSLVPPRPRVETGFAAAHKCAFWSTLSVQRER